jgi:hypothetical protein
MTINYIKHFDSQGRLRNLSDWCIYSAFANLPDGGGIVKVGISQSPLRRIYNVHCGSPFEIEAALWAHVGTKESALSIERSVKYRFASHRTRGEWFSFDFASQDEKQFFHATFHRAYMRTTGRRLAWRKTTIEKIKEVLEVA